MVDRIARDRYAELIRHFCAGLMTNREYENRADTILRRSKDEALAVVFTAVWGLYDDLYTHRMNGRHRLDRKTRREVARCLLFLQSEDEYRWPLERGYTSAQLMLLALAALGLYWCADLRWYGGVVLGVSLVLFAAVGSWRTVLRQRAGDEEAWPFLYSEGLEEARRHPRLLNGRQPR